MTAATAAAPTRTRSAAKRTTRPRARQDSLRAAIYVRISLDSTGEHLGVQRQEQDARAICAERGWQAVGLYSDNSISASDARKRRPGYEALRRDYDAGLFDALVCYDLDRLTRQPRQLEDWIDAAEGRGLALVTTNGEADLTTDAGRLFARIKAAVARSEIERKSARHKSALRQHAGLGKVPHGPALYGYTTTGDTVPDEADVVRRIFKAFDGGESLRSLARSLTADGVPTRSGRPWNTRTIRDMLTNPRYAGWAVYHREIATDDNGNRVRGQWEPLVSIEMFDVVQARLSDPSRKTNRVGTDRRYLGSGLFVCDTCGEPVQTLNGGKYVCRGHLTREHSHVDHYVLMVVAERLGRKDFAKLLAPPESEMAPVVAESERLRKRLAKIDNDYDTGGIDARRWKAAKQRVQAELAEVDKQLVTRRGGSALGAVAGAPDPAAAFLGASLMGQRAVIEALCVVRLRRAGRGRLPKSVGFIDPATVFIDWRA
ncbi:recombinase family protein [Mycobacterium sp.]|uniref:recombinase family protein n=1 Tax=Mycobacterium sp. TaxID=1785 RepID=UPI003D6AA369